MKGVPFLSKMVLKRVRGRTSGRSLPVLKFVQYPPPPLGSLLLFLILPLGGENQSPSKSRFRLGLRKPRLKSKHGLHCIIKTGVLPTTKPLFGKSSYYVCVKVNQKGRQISLRGFTCIVIKSSFRPRTTPCLSRGPFLESPVSFQGPKSHFKTCDPLILKTWPFTMISRYESEDLQLNFISENIFLFGDRQDSIAPQIGATSFGSFEIRALPRRLTRRAFPKFSYGQIISQ